MFRRTDGTLATAFKKTEIKTRQQINSAFEPVFWSIRETNKPADSIASTRFASLPGKL